MGLFIGSQPVAAVYLGDVEITSAFIGATLALDAGIVPITMANLRENTGTEIVADLLADISGEGTVFLVSYPADPRPISSAQVYADFQDTSLTEPKVSLVLDGNTQSPALVPAVDLSAKSSGSTQWVAAILRSASGEFANADALVEDVVLPGVPETIIPLDGADFVLSKGFGETGGVISRSAGVGGGAEVSHSGGAFLQLEGGKTYDLNWRVSDYQGGATARVTLKYQIYPANSRTGLITEFAVNRTTAFGSGTLDRHYPNGDGRFTDADGTNNQYVLSGRFQMPTTGPVFLQAIFSAPNDETMSIDQFSYREVTT